MAANEKEYSKLPGTKKGFLIGRYTLWQGSDHLLQVYSRVGVEEYKRFYFNDIQAVIAHKTIVGKFQNIGLGSLILIFLVPALKLDGGWELFYSAVASIPVLLLLVNFYRGPTCETRLMTAVQTEKLHSLHRLKSTLKVMDGLRKHIEGTQGALRPEATHGNSRRSAAKSKAIVRKQQNAPKKAALRDEKGRVHMILFVLLLLGGVLVALGFLVTHVALTIASTIASFGMGIFVIIALVKQHDSRMSGSLKAITWASLGFICINFAAGYLLSIFYAFQNPSLVYNQWEVFKSMSLLSPWDNPLKLSFDIFTFCGAPFLGVPGLFLLNQAGSGHAAKPPAKTSTYRKPVAQSNNTESG